GGVGVYATDFHNGKVDVFDTSWHRIERPGAFQDPSISPWYEPYNVMVSGRRVFVTYASKAPVNGNDSPHGGYVNEFDLDGGLIARGATSGPANRPGGRAAAAASLPRVGRGALRGAA